ncbi:hypothetical protein QE152_g32022 [Popillia japonica]|uniref:Uncharacterized protein n=1 Tax=Popillia japonica TaxID=7064 RepID=A0AAW1J035_POPJA
MLKSIETRLATLEAQPSRSSEFFESMRLGAATTKKPRPIRVVFTNPFVVRDILKNKSKLASIANYKEVFLKHDQTAHQRELYAKCRESLYARLSNGEKNLRIKFINGLPSKESLFA